MDTARNAAFAALTNGAKFNRGRFKRDIQQFQAKPVSPSIQPAAAPSHLPSLDFFNEEDGDRSEPATDAESDTQGAAAPVKQGEGETPLPVPGQAKQRRIRKENRIKASGNDIPAPADSFTALASWYKVPEYLMRNTFSRGFRTPTPIQMQVLPCLLSNRDVLAVAPTGSGKTYAFLLPLLAKLRRPQKEKAMRAIVLAHSKELAAQSERELRFLAKGRPWDIQTMQKSKAAVSRRDILVSTPARLISFMEEQSLDLSHVEYIVFDEADKLFDDSHERFLEQMQKILNSCTSPKRQVAVFSATMPEKAEGLIRTFLNNPCRVMVGTRASASCDVKQELIYCGMESGKLPAIRQLLQKGLAPPVLVFVQSIDRAKDLYLELLSMGISAAAIHSDCIAVQRDDIVRKFRLGKVNVLVCTELMARGVDFKGVGTVINYDCPTTITSYIHRIGRTGRAGHAGSAYTMWTDEDHQYLRQIGNVIRQAGGEVPEWILKLKKEKGSKKAMPKREAVSAVRRVREAQEKQRKRSKQPKKRQREGEEKAADGSAEHTPPEKKSKKVAKASGDETAAAPQQKVRKTKKVKKVKKDAQ